MSTWSKRLNLYKLLHLTGTKKANYGVQKNRTSRLCFSFLCKLNNALEMFQISIHSLEIFNS